MQIKTSELTEETILRTVRPQLKENEKATKFYLKKKSLRSCTYAQL